VLVPVMYSLLDDFDDWMKRLFGRPSEEDATQVSGVYRPASGDSQPSVNPAAV
jgi:hypothetical protein